MPSDGNEPQGSETQFLVRAALRGDPESFGKVFERVAPALYAWAALRVPGALRSQLDPEDVVQEVWCRAYERLSAFDPERGLFRAWVFGIAHHVVLKAFRRLRETSAAARAIDMEQVPDPATSISRRVARDEILSRFIASVRVFDDDERNLLLLRGFEARPLQEVAKLLGLSPEATRKRWQRLRERLQEIAMPSGLLES